MHPLFKKAELLLIKKNKHLVQNIEEMNLI